MTPLPEVVVTAFRRKGLELPDSERVDRMGYSFQETKIIDAETARRRKAEEE